MEEDNNNNNINNNNNNGDNSNNKNESKSGVDEIYVSDSKVENFPGFQEKRSLAERRGFNSNAARINTALYRAGTTPLASPVARSSPNLTIPPGISPTTFLDSPMMLPNSYVCVIISLSFYYFKLKKMAFFVFFCNFFFVYVCFRGCHHQPLGLSSCCHLLLMKDQ